MEGRKPEQLVRLASSVTIHKVNKSAYGTKLKLKLARGSQQEDLDRPCVNQWQEHATVLLYYRLLACEEVRALSNARCAEEQNGPKSTHHLVDLAWQT